MSRTNLSDAFSVWMKANNDTARRLAPYLGMSHATLSRFLQGKEISSMHFQSILGFLLSSATPGGTNE